MKPSLGRIRAVSAALLGACVLAAAAGAVDNAGPGVFSTHDLNRDGFVDRREYYQFRQRVRMRQQGPRGHGPRLHEFEYLDANGDGRIGREELLERLESARHAGH